MDFEIIAAIKEEKHIVISWILRGPNLGMIWEYSPMNKAIKTNGFTIYHFKEDLICGHS